MNAFVCNSPVQLIRAISLKLRDDFFSDEADIYISSIIKNSSSIVKRLIDTKIFENVYWINLNELGSRTIFKLLFTKNSYSRILRKNKYKKLFSFNIEDSLTQALFNINKKNKDFEYHCIEDCPGIYSIYVPSKYKFYHPYNILKIQKPCFHIKTWWTSCPDLIRIPSEFTNKVKQLPIIDYNDEELLKKLNFIFNYKYDSKLKKYKYFIMEESHYVDGLMIDNYDFILYKKVINFVGRENVIVKLHPRTTNNRFINVCDYLEADGIPWELFVFNILKYNKTNFVIISIACGTLFSDKLLFNDESVKFVLAPIFKDKIRSKNGNSRVNDDLLLQYIKFKNQYNDPSKFLIFETEDELWKELR